jgi:hypothetical protein
MDNLHRAYVAPGPGAMLTGMMHIDPDVTEDKYIVTKLDGTPVDDAVVIRLKDPYASSALHAYCSAILTVLDLMQDDMDPDLYQQQLDIADYFHQQAVESSKIKGKRMPD